MKTKDQNDMIMKHFLSKHREDGKELEAKTGLTSKVIYKRLWDLHQNELKKRSFRIFKIFNTKT